MGGKEVELKGDQPGSSCSSFVHMASLSSCHVVMSSATVVSIISSCGMGVWRHGSGT